MMPVHKRYAISMHIMFELASTSSIIHNLKHKECFCPFMPMFQALYHTTQQQMQ
jgi:hypothetical protein